MVSIWAILVGGMVNLAARNVLTLAALFLWASGAERPDLAHPAGHPVFAALAWALVAAASVAGGYVAAWLARRNEVLHGVLAAWAAAAFSLWDIGHGQAPGVMLALGQGLITFLFSGLGGWLRAAHLAARNV